MTTDDIEAALTVVQESNMHALIGGYNIDVAIIAMIAVLQLEDDLKVDTEVNAMDDMSWREPDTDAILDRVNKAIHELYAGRI